jgi:hypothetical protein
MNFALNGQSFKQICNWDAPVVIQLKGNLETAAVADSDVVTSVAFSNQQWVMGAIQGFVNDHKATSHETGVLLSRSFNGMYIEGQASMISGAYRNDTEIKGNRYQFTFGYDSANVSPFLQYQYLTEGTKFGNTALQGVYFGLDTDLISYQIHETNLTSKLLAKAGYEFGSHDKLSGYLEWDSSIKFNGGLEFSSTVQIDAKSNVFKLSFSYAD